MKKIRLLFATMLALLLSVSIASCSDNNDEPPTPDSESIDGTYRGDLECTVMGSASVFDNKEFKITAIDESTVSIELPAFGDAPMAMPAIRLDGVKVTETDGTVTLATTEVSGVSDSGKNYTVTVTGTVKDNTLELKFNLQFGAMPMPLICQTTATRQ